MKLHATVVAVLVLSTALVLSGCTLVEQIAPLARVDALGGRVELPEAGIAVTFPDDWLRESPPSLAGGGVAAVLEPDQRDLLVPLLRVMPPSRHDWCVVADIAPLVEAQAEWQTLDDVVGGFKGRLAADPRWVGLDTTILGLPAGPTGQITRVVAHEASSVTTYIFTQPGAWSMLECVAQTVRPKDWLPVAESFEFLRGPAGAAPVGFSGTLGQIGDECGLGVSVEVVDGVQRTRGYCSVQPLIASDPRISGSYTRFANVDEYVGADVIPDAVLLRASTVTHRIASDGGVWLGDATASITVDDVGEGGEDRRSPEVVVFTGSDGYEGLSAIVWWQPQGSDPEVRGVIIRGPLPPAPPAAVVFPILPAESTFELRLTHPDLAFRVDVTLYGQDGRYLATADLGEDSRDVGVGATPQEAVRAALQALGEPYASEMAESLTG